MLNCHLLSAYVHIGTGLFVRPAISIQNCLFFLMFTLDHQNTGHCKTDRFSGVPICGGNYRTSIRCVEGCSVAAAVQKQKPMFEAQTSKPAIRQCTKTQIQNSNLYKQELRSYIL